MKCMQITLKSGQKRWECVTEGPRDPVTGKRTQIRRRGKTRAEAKRRVEQALMSLEEHQIDETVRMRITFEQVASNWLETYKLTGVKRSTVRIREKELKILNKYMAKMPIVEINHSFYQNFINKISPEYARTTVQGINTTAGMVFKHAKKDKIIKDLPNQDVIIPKKRRTVKEIETDPIEEKYLTTEELEEFLNATLEHGLDLDIERFYLLAFSGMRSGELCALKWSDVDFDENTIRITKTLYNENNNMREYELTPPKTEGSIRVISVEKEVMDLLKSHRKRQMKLKMKYRHELEEYHDGNFVFSRVNGYPFVPKNIGDRMRRLLEYTNITKKATPHIFRHTRISMLTEAGVDLATIMQQVGHDDPQTTLRIYTHVTQKMKKDASEKVRTFYGNILEKIQFSKIM